MLENKEFTSAIFKLSTDYRNLWWLAKLGNRIPAWILYSDEFDEPIYDLVEIKTAWKGTEVTIGHRGKGYVPCDESFDAFQNLCEQLKLKYIEQCR